ncbi:MAG: hypothetical protein M3Y59_22150 [Myxococcota bacterium]|nr:hypothetical protein [Myxococcota bacterium]
MSSPLPVRRVVLYKHGVAYFERRGTIEGNQSLSLDFRARDMNDVLKSMTVLDLNGGSVSSVSYDSTKPLEKLLEEATIRLPEEGSLSALLGQIKGARVRLRVGPESVEGAILGLERLQLAVEKTSLERPFLALLTAGGVRTFDLLEIRELAFLDEAVRKDLEFYLATVLSSYKKDSKRVAILTSGEGKRELFVSYVLEAPVWKTSYRILIEDQQPPLLQGWAVVDNTGDEDWLEVELALIAGLPVSFVHDLYSPRYQQRPVVQVRTQAGAAPIIPEEAYDGASASAAAPAPMAKARKRMASDEGAVGGAPSRRELMESSQPVTTAVQEVGDLFEYRVEKPVSVHRNQSALVPILQRPFEGRKVLLYNREAREKNPMACLELKNTTGLTLEGGPVTVFDGETYVGEAMLDTLKPDDRRFVPYAVELSTVVSRDDQQGQSAVFRAAVVRGVLTTHFFHVRHTAYRVRNKSQRAQTLFLEHPRSGWELFDTAAPAETTDHAWRFRLELAAGQETPCKVSERSEGTQHFSLDSSGRDQLQFFLGSRFIDQRIHDALAQVLVLKEQLGQVQAEEQRLVQERNTVHKDQERLRANLGALQSGADQRDLSERIVSKLGAQEDRLEKIEETLTALAGNRTALQQEIQTRIAQLSFTAELGERR